MKKWSGEFFSEKGVTLVEIVASIAILSIIITTLCAFFLQSSNANATSKRMEEATYIGQNCMEEWNERITTTPQPTNLSLFTPSGYSKVMGTTSSYEKNPNTTGHYVWVDLVPKTGSLVRVKVKVYKDSSKNKLEAQMEMFVSWKQ